MTVSVLIPYYPSSPRRKDIFSWVIQRWQHFFPDFEYCIGSSYGPEFDRSWARNRAFQASSGDIVIVADADTIPDPQFVERAVDIASSTQRYWVLPYGRQDYYNLDKDCSDLLMALSPDVPIGRDGLQWEHKLESWAGILVMPREAFVEVGGYDTQFLGWGYEDNSFRLALDTLWGPLIRIPDGFICHLWHEAPESERFEQPNISHNQLRYALYQTAYGNKEAMRALKGNSLSESSGCRTR